MNIICTCYDEQYNRYLCQILINTTSYPIVHFFNNQVILFFYVLFLKRVSIIIILGPIKLL